MIAALPVRDSGSLLEMREGIPLNIVTSIFMISTSFFEMPVVAKAPKAPCMQSAAAAIT
jgi:hypothetical protein